MSKLQHISWYLMIIASVYSATGNREAFWAVTAGALVILVASFFERKQ